MASITSVCYTRVRVAIAIRSSDDANELEERISRMEVLTKQYHSRPGGLCCVKPRPLAP